MCSPVIIEVPHFASLRGKEREIVILRSDNGETWREHTLEASEEAVQDVLNESFEGEGMIFKAIYNFQMQYVSYFQMYNKLNYMQWIISFFFRAKPTRRSPNVSHRENTYRRLSALFRGSISHQARGPCGRSRRWYRIVVRCTTSTSCLPASSPH